jgi:hypothetical protein
MNAKRRRLLDRMLAFPQEGEGQPRRQQWERFAGRGGLSVRWLEELDTPEWVTPRMWPGATYTRHVSVTMVHENAKPLVRLALAPWVEARDTEVTLARALSILADPGWALGWKPCT